MTRASSSSFFHQELHQSGSEHQILTTRALAMQIQNRTAITGSQLRFTCIKIDASSPRDGLKDALVQSRNSAKRSADERTEASLYIKKLLLPKTETVTQDDRQDWISDDEEERRSDKDYEGGKTPSVPQQPPQRRIMLPESEKQHECPICSRRFAHPRSLQQHSKKVEL